MKNNYLLTRLLILALLPPCLAMTTPKAIADYDIQKKAHQIHTHNPEVPKNVLTLGLKAYKKAAQQGKVQQPYLTIIDYSQPSDHKRMWVIDMLHNTVPYHTYVAHGKNSGMRKTEHFSNKNGSHTSSFGVFVTQNTYFGKKGYSLRLNGLESGINDSAFQRAIVMHGAQYAGANFLKQAGYLGRSWGCPAIPTQLARPIISKIKNGSLIFAYYPNANWLHHSKFLV